jgi:hypothetical protein
LKEQRKEKKSLIVSPSRFKSEGKEGKRERRSTRRRRMPSTEKFPRMKYSGENVMLKLMPTTGGKF